MSWAWECLPHNHEDPMEKARYGGTHLYLKSQSWGDRSRQISGALVCQFSQLMSPREVSILSIDTEA